MFNIIKLYNKSFTIPNIFIGYYSKDLIVGVGSHFFGSAIFNYINFMNIFDAEFISVFYKTLPVNFSLVGFFLAFMLYIFSSNMLFIFKISFIGNKFYTFLNRKWFFDKIYNEFLGQFFFKFGYSISYKFVDRGIFEILGPTGISLNVLNIGQSFHRMQTGSLYHITLTILISVSLLFSIRQFI